LLFWADTCTGRAVSGQYWLSPGHSGSRKGCHMRRFRLVRPAMVALILLLPGSGALPGAEPRTGIAVWDTGQPSATSLPAAALAGKNGWTAVSVEKAEAFKGDAVLT